MTYMVMHLTVDEWLMSGPSILKFLFHEKKCTVNDFRLFQDFDLAPADNKNKVMHVEIKDAKLAMEFKLRYG